MKISILITVLSLLTAMTVKANATDQGTLTKISCINSEMNSEEIQASSGSFLEMKAGDTVSVSEIRKLVTNDDGSIKAGMGVMENQSKLQVLVKAKGFCQKAKTERAADGTDKVVEVVGTIVLSIQK